MNDTVSLFRSQGQLGLGEDRIHVSAPHLLNYSQLAGVTGVRAGDSSSAAVTGEPDLRARTEGSSLPQHPSLSVTADISHCDVCFYKIFKSFIHCV